MKILPSAQDETDRQYSSSTVASASGGESLSTPDTVLLLPTPQPQQEVKSEVSAATTAIETAPLSWKPPAAVQCNLGSPHARPTGTHEEAEDCSNNPQTSYSPYSLRRSSSRIGPSGSSATVGNPAASSLVSLPSASRPQPLSVCLPSSSSNSSGNGCLNSPSRLRVPTAEHQQKQQLLQLPQDQPVSCIIVEGFSGEVAYIEFVPQGDHTGLQLLARARRRGKSSALLRVAAAAFEPPTASEAKGPHEATETAATAARKPHASTIAVQQLKPLLQHSPILADARERGVGGSATSPSSSSSSASRGSPRCWVVGYEELIEGLLPAWRSLSDVGHFNRWPLFVCLLSLWGSALPLALYVALYLDSFSTGASLYPGPCFSLDPFISFVSVVSSVFFNVLVLSLWISSSLNVWFF